MPNLVKMQSLIRCKFVNIYGTLKRSTVPTECRNSLRKVKQRKQSARDFPNTGLFRHVSTVTAGFPVGTHIGSRMRGGGLFER